MTAKTRRVRDHAVQAAARAGMVLVPGGDAELGSTEFYPEEQPLRTVTVPTLWVDAEPVTNRRFRRFAKATGYLTRAERELDPADFPGAGPGDLVPGSLVFQRSAGPVSLTDSRRWWSYVPAAHWSAPRGPGSSLRGLSRHPVVHVAHEDAIAYAEWAGKRLPTEAEWEYAARGGRHGARYAWGDEFMPQGRIMANTWHGPFPWRHELPSGGKTTPVRSYPANEFGLFDMIGNVWEWTASRWIEDQGGAPEEPSACCASGGEGVRFVIKGGSHLCAPSYCQRYRPAARQGQASRSTTSHLGFRCVADP